MRLIYLSPVPWDSFSQRSHKFSRWFHERSGNDILWIDPYPTRFPTLEDLRSRFKEPEIQCETTPAWLQVVRPKALPIEPLPGSGWLNRWLWSDVFTAVEAFQRKAPAIIGVGKPSEMAIRLLEQYPDIPSFYDAMDNFTFFYQGLSKSAMARRERRVVAQVSKVLVSSTSLYRRFSRQRKGVFFVPNACAPNTLPKGDRPSSGHTADVLGYIGTIGQWFDWEFIFALAHGNPATQVRLIGPVYSPPPRKLPDNVELLGACHHATAMLAMGQFSVGLIPFKKTQLTDSIDPIKYYEYRALGLPVISTRFGEMSLREHEPGVVLVDEHTDMVSAVDKALAYQADLEEIHEFRGENSWEARFDASGLLSGFAGHSSGQDKTF